MYVQVGNDHAIVGEKDERSDDPDRVEYSDIEGQRVTEIHIPEDIPLGEAFAATVNALSHHIHREHGPAWIESDSAGLQALLLEHYKLPESKGKRPKTWGKDTGADQIPTIAAQHEEDSE